MGEKKKAYQCTVCNKIHSRAEGKCPCGADLATFGKEIDDPDSENIEEIHRPDPVPPKPDPVPIKKGRRFLKVAGILAGVFVIFLICIFILDTMKHRQDDEPDHAGETADAAEERSDDSAADPTDTPMPSASAVPTQEAVGDPEEEMEPGNIYNAMEENIYSIFLYQDNQPVGSDIVCSDTIFWKKTWAKTNKTWAEIQAGNYNLDVINSQGKVLAFRDVSLKPDDTLEFRMEEDVPYLNIQLHDREEKMSFQGNAYFYQDYYEDESFACKQLFNITDYTFKEMYIYSADTDNTGDNLIKLYLSDDVLNPKDSMKCNIDLTSSQSVYLTDDDGGIWFYENIDFSGAHLISIWLDDKGQPCLLLSYGKDPEKLMAGKYYKDEG